MEFWPDRHSIYAYVNMELKTFMPALSTYVDIISLGYRFRTGAVLSPSGCWGFSWGRYYKQTLKFLFLCLYLFKLICNRHTYRMSKITYHVKGGVRIYFSSKKYLVLKRLGTYDLGYPAKQLNIADHNFLTNWCNMQSC